MRQFIFIFFILASGCASQNVKDCKDRSRTQGEKCETIEVETLNDCRYKDSGSGRSCRTIDLDSF